MKWKKQGDSWRCYSGEIQMRVQAIDDLFMLTWCRSKGSWDEGVIYPNLVEAKAKGEELIELMDAVVKQEKDILSTRRKFYDDRQKRIDAMTPAEKSYIRAFELYRQMPEHDKGYVRGLRPDLTAIFDKLILEENQKTNI
jgi:hypothetical protein